MLKISNIFRVSCFPQWYSRRELVKMSDSSERTVLTLDFAVSPLSFIEEMLFLWCHLLTSLPHTCTEENSRKNCDWTIRIWRSSVQDIWAYRGKKYFASRWTSVFLSCMELCPWLTSSLYVVYIYMIWPPRRGATFWCQYKRLDMGMKTQVIYF